MIFANQACAKAFARDGAAGVCLADLSSENLETLAEELRGIAAHPNFKVHTVLTDCSKAEDCQNAVAEAVAAFGRIDVRQRGAVRVS
jgi:NAD(P)-dependent dehydrogenase (short-subunit alcohol dehydrogenase family)